MNRSVSPAPSATRGESMDTVGAPSSSTMTPAPLDAAPRVAFTTPLSASATVSSVSSVASPSTDTATVRAVSPGAKASVPAASAA